MPLPRATGPERVIRQAAAACLCLSISVQTALANCAADAMVVFDASASMTAQEFDATGRQRIHDARAALAEVMPKVEDLRRIGLVVYGPGGAGVCDGISPRFPPLDRAAARMAQEVGATLPGGLTPLSEATRQAAEALDYRTRPGVIVLVTDGNESCGGAPCALADTLAADAANLTVHVIGFKVVWDAFARHGDRQAPYYGAEILARCLADRTGGTYVSTESLGELIEALKRTLGCLVIGETGGPGARSEKYIRRGLGPAKQGKFDVHPPYTRRTPPVQTFGVR